MMLVTYFIEQLYKGGNQFISEGFSLAILESLNHNTPVIAYDVPYGPNEFIQDDINATPLL